MIWSLVYSLPRVEELPVASFAFWFPSAGRSRLLRCQLSFLRGRGGAVGEQGGGARAACWAVARGVLGGSVARAAAPLM